MARHHDDALRDALLDRASLPQIRKIVRKWPSLVRQKVWCDLCEHERWPLHMAVAEGLPLEVVKFLYWRYPQALKEWDRDDKSTLLHHLGPGSDSDEFPIRVDTLAFLLQQWPEALQQKTTEGELPFHVANANRNLSMEVVRFMLEQHPQALRERDHAGFLPLHWAVRSDDPPPELVQLLVNEWPGSVLNRGARGLGTMLPLRLALSSGASLDIVRILVEPWPPSIRHKDWYGGTALHDAIASHASVETVRYLVDQSPQSLQEPTHEGFVPLHFAVWHGAAADVVELLIERRPEALQVRDHEGRVPLHVAAAFGSGGQRGPFPRSALDSQGQLPLHLALSHRTWSGSSKGARRRRRRRRLSPELLVRILLAARPASVHVRDRQGRLPLHVAVSRGNNDDDDTASVETVRCLVEAWPESILVPELSSGGLVPMLLAATSNASLDVLCFLVRRSPELFVRP